jgi:peptide/nickel transport system permease protein
VIAYILRRVGLYLVTFWAAVTLNFLLPRMMPGSPTDTVIAKMQGRGLSAAAIKQLETALGVSHGSLIGQYKDYLVNLAHFEFGVSVNFYPVSVSYLIRQALPWTLMLVGTATVLAFLIGSLLGVLAGWRRNRAFDSIATTTGTFLGAFPFFWTGLVLTYVLALKMGWFPIGGGSDDGPSWSWAFVGNALHHSILPALSVVIAGVGTWLLAMRNNMINVLGEDYVLFAQANGIRGSKIALLYAARNAILPNVTALGIVIGSVVGGSLLVEIVFSYPGMGYLLFQAVTSNDYALMQAIFLTITVGVLLANFFVDLLYLWLDPRMRR